MDVGRGTGAYPGSESGKGTPGVRLHDRREAQDLGVGVQADIVPIPPRPTAVPGIGASLSQLDALAEIDFEGEQVDVVATSKPDPAGINEGPGVGGGQGDGEESSENGSEGSGEGSSETLEEEGLEAEEGSVSLDASFREDVQDLPPWELEAPEVANDVVEEPPEEDPLDELRALVRKGPGEVEADRLSHELPQPRSRAPEPRVAAVTLAGTGLRGVQHGDPEASRAAQLAATKNRLRMVVTGVVGIPPKKNAFTAGLSEAISGGVRDPGFNPETGRIACPHDSADRLAVHVDGAGLQVEKQPVLPRVDARLDAAGVDDLLSGLGDVPVPAPARSRVRAPRAAEASGEPLLPAEAADAPISPQPPSPAPPVAVSVVEPLRELGAVKAAPAPPLVEPKRLLPWSERIPAWAENTAGVVALVVVGWLAVLGFTPAAPVPVEVVEARAVHGVLSRWQNDLDREITALEAEAIAVGGKPVLTEAERSLLVALARRRARLVILREAVIGRRSWVKGGAK